MKRIVLLKNKETKRFFACIEADNTNDEVREIAQRVLEEGLDILEGGWEAITIETSDPKVIEEYRQRVGEIYE